MVSVPAPSFPHQLGSELASVPLVPRTSVLPLHTEENVLPSAVLANGSQSSFSMPDTFFDDGDMVLGDELDDLLDSAPETNGPVMVSTLANGGAAQNWGEEEGDPISLSGVLRAQCPRLPMIDFLR